MTTLTTPWNFDIDSDLGLLSIVLHSSLSINQLQSIAESVIEHPLVEPGVAILADFSCIETPAEPGIIPLLSPLLMRLGNHLGPARVAVFATTVSLLGNARFSELLSWSTPINIRAFRNRPSALDWCLRKDRPGLWRPRFHHK